MLSIECLHAYAAFVGIVDMVEASLASFSYLLKGDEQIAQTKIK